MSLHRADVRFALPGSPRTAVVLGGLTGWEEGLRQGGVEVGTTGAADLAVAPAALAVEAAATGAPMLVLEGARRHRAAAASGYSVQAVLPLPDARTPELLLPLGQRAAVRYAVRRWRPGTTPLETTRNLAARELIARGIAPPGRAPTAIAAREAGPPAFVAAAAELVGTVRLDWFAAFGLWPNPETRGAFFLFERGRPEPDWVVKFARIPGLERVFDGDAAGLARAADAGGLVAAAAPRLLGRLDADPLCASVETAAHGERLSTILRGGAARADKLALVERFAEWLVAVARQTAAPAATLAPERERLEREVVPRWTGRGLPADVVARLPSLASVFQHGDLWGDNIFVAKTGFGVVDWESAKTHGAPLWDLLYFLTGALALADGARTDDETLEHLVRLCRGELPSSAVLFRQLRVGAAATDVPPEAIGPLAALLWTSYALLDSEHAERVARSEGVATPAVPLTVRIAERWLTDPGLGTGWRAWL